MATPISPNHQMATTSSPQSPMETLGKAHSIKLQPRVPAVATVWKVNKKQTSSKPKRPYTPYNLFYLLERELAVQKINGPPSTKRNVTSTVPPRPEEQVKIPSRYDGIVMAPYWYDPNMKEKRKHRKTHGSISFKELTGIISANWATVDKTTKDYVTAISEMGRKRYREEMARFNASQKKIESEKEQASKGDDNTTAIEPLKRQPSSKKNAGSPARRKKGSLKGGKPIPVTPDRRNLPIAHKPKPSAPPVVTPPHRYNLPNLPMYQYQLPPSLPPTVPQTSTPVMPVTMSWETGMMPSYQHRARQFEYIRSANTTSRQYSQPAVGRDAPIRSNNESASQDEALQLNSLMHDELMNFEPDHHITEDVFEDNVKATFDSPVPKTVEDEDILDMIKGDSMWNNLDHFNYDEEPFPFLSD